MSRYGVDYFERGVIELGSKFRDNRNGKIGVITAIEKPFPDDNRYWVRFDCLPDKSVPYLQSLIQRKILQQITNGGCDED